MHGARCACVQEFAGAAEIIDGKQLQQRADHVNASVQQVRWSDGWRPEADQADDAWQLPSWWQMTHRLRRILGKAPDNRTPGGDQLPNEFLKAGGWAYARHLGDLGLRALRAAPAGGRPTTSWSGSRRFFLFFLGGGRGTRCFSPFRFSPFFFILFPPLFSFVPLVAFPLSRL